MKMIDEFVYKNRKILTLFSVLVLITSMLVLFVKSAYAYEGWKLSLEWKDSTNTSTSYVWNSNKDEEKTIRLNVKYSNSDVGNTGYKAGELVITVPGIGDANRDKNLEGVIGANKVTDTEKTRDWTYTYNSATNTYTFTNNKDIPAHYNLSGQFELVWQMKSRNTKNDYINNLKAELLTPVETIESNVVQYAETREKDTFNVDQYAMSMYGAQGVEAGLNVNDYIWVRYNVAADYNAIKSVGIDDDLYYEIKVPNGAIVTASTTGDVEKIDALTYKIKTQYYKQNDEKYNFFDDINNMANITARFYVAYPRSTFQNQTITNTVNLKGTYYEDDVETILATITKQVSLADFSFINIPGSIYLSNKCIYGSAKNSEAVDDYDKTICKNKYIAFTNGNKLQNNEVNTIRMYGSINTNGTKYSMEMVDDFLYVKQNDGNLRALTGNDYEFTNILIPSSTSLINYNNMPIESDKYSAEIYANGILYKTIFIGDSQTIQLPAGTNKVGVKLIDVDQSIIDFYADLTIKYHLEDLSNIDITNSSLYNTMYTKIYNESGDFINNNYTQDNYDNATNIDFAQKDLDTYGTYLDREKAEIHIHERSDAYCNTTSLSDITQTNNGFSTELTMGTTYSYLEDETLAGTGIYTVLPEGLKLPNGYKSISDIYKYITVEGLSKAYDNNYIANHMSPIVIENYNNTKKTYLGFKFDFSDNPIVEPSRIIVKVNLFISSEDYQVYGDNWNVSTASFIDDGDMKESCNKTVDTDDLDKDGNTTETISKGFASKSIVYAASSESRTLKQVATLSNNYEYANEAVEADFGNTYQYKLLFELGQNKGKNIVITDIFEDISGAQWKGTFDSIDLSNVEALGYTPVLEYTTDKTTWSTTYTSKEAVKGIKVTLNEKTLEAGKILSIIVNMKAPTDTSLFGQVTKNSYTANYTAIDGSTNVETDNVTQTSNTAEITLIDIVNVKLSKLDSETSTGIAGAVFTLYDSNNNALGDYTSNANGVVDVNIKVRNASEYKTYKLVEKNASIGYALDQTPVIFTIDGTDLTFSKTNTKIKTTLSLLKQNSLDDKFIVSGAVYTLYKDEVAVGNYTTNNDGKIIVDVLWGHSYYFKEKTSPDGLELNQDNIDLDITKNNAGATQIIVTKDVQTNPGYVLLTKYETTEDGTKTENALKGATYNLYRAHDNSLVGTYVTDASGTILVGDLAIGSYYFKEMNAPLGYKANPDNVEFTLTKDNLSVDNSVKVKDYDQRKPGEILIKKTDTEGYQLSGVIFDIYYESDTQEKILLGTYTTDSNGFIQLTDLKWGTYYLEETKSQSGYELLGDNTTFVVDAESVSKGSFNVEPLVVVNKEKSGSVKFTKTAEDGTSPVVGAKYSLYKTDGTLVKEDLTTDAQGVINISGLSWGSYYLEETYAPTGYGISSEKVRFSINNFSAGSDQELSATDKTDSKDITVEKKIKISDIVYEHGYATFIFKLNGTDINSKEHTYYKTLTFDKEYVEDYVATNPTATYITASIILADIPAGSYTLEEENVQRYETNEVTSDVGVVSNNKVTFDLNANASGKATFTNNNITQGKLTHTSVLTNIIKASKKLTTLSVKYNKIDEVDPGYVINRNDLEVYALYDDGTSKKLTNSDYTLSITDDKIPDDAKSTYNVKVSYTESGITKTGSFVVNITKSINDISNCELPGHESLIACKVLTNGVGTSANDTVNIIDKTTDEETYFIEGEKPNNWVYYSGKLWRIVSINPTEGTVKLITEDIISPLMASDDDNLTYENSMLDQWLTEIFEPTLYNSTNLVATSVWDTAYKSGEIKPTYETTVTRKVALLNPYEVMNSYKTAGQNLGYLYKGFWWLMSIVKAPNYPEAINYDTFQTTNGGKIIDDDDSYLLNGVRPSINFVSGVKVTSGDGTKSNPYRILDDIPTAKNGDLLNTRISGEYVEFNGYKYRIVDTETLNANKLTKITVFDNLKDGSGNIIKKYFSNAYGNVIYDPTDTNYYQAYYLNTDPSGFYQTLPSNYKNMITDGIWYLGMYSNYSKNSEDFHNTTSTASSCNSSNVCTVIAKIGLPRVTELWSTKSYTESEFWTLTPWDSGSVRLSGSSGRTNGNNPHFSELAISPSMYLKPDVKIISGDGTESSPYVISQ